MSKTDAPPAPATMQVVMAEKTHRPSYEVADELTAARAEFHELFKKAEADRTQVAMNQEIWDRAVEEWGKKRPGTPFQPGMFFLPPERARIDDDLHRRFHKQHYVVARLENELEASKKSEVGG